MLALERGGDSVRGALSLASGTVRFSRTVIRGTLALNYFRLAISPVVERKTPETASVQRKADQ